MELEDYECSVCTGGCAVWDGEPGMRCPKGFDDLVKWEVMKRKEANSIPSVKNRTDINMSNIKYHTGV